MELARRYLLINHGVIFDSIPMAYDIFKLKSVRKVSDNSLIRMDAHSNGSRVRWVGSLLWKVGRGCCLLRITGRACGCGSPLR